MSASSLEHLAPDADLMETPSKPTSLFSTVISSGEGKFGLALLVVMVIIIALGPLVAPYPPNKLMVGTLLETPSRAHPLGTDDLGRDVLSRFLSGGRSVVMVPVAAVTLALIVGGFLGMLGAYRGGRVDEVVARGFDLMMSLPGLLVILVLVAGLGTSPLTIIISVAFIFSSRLGRTVRGATMTVVANDYVQSAQLRGERTTWILTRELLPNITGPVLMTYTLYVTYGIIAVASLSFLGLGAQPPSSDWGLMVAQSRGFVALNPWATFAPAFGIAGLSVAFTLIADAVNRYLSHESGSKGTVV